MTRREEAIQKAAQADWEHTYFISWDEATDEEKAAWLESTANVITAYEAHMRPEIDAVAAIDALPIGTVVLAADRTVWTKAGDEELDWWERATDEMGYGNSDVDLPARVLHWGAE